MSFSSDLEKFKTKTERQLADFQRNIVVNLFSAVVISTPVDTGRLRRNWMISENKIDRSTTEETDKSGAVQISNIMTFVTGEQKLLYLANNLPYAKPIEYGHSKFKAPAGMVRINVARMREFVKLAARQK